MSLAKEIDPDKDEQKNVLFPTEELYSDEPPLESDLHLQTKHLQNWKNSKLNCEN